MGLLPAAASAPRAVGRLGSLRNLGYLGLLGYRRAAGRLWARHRLFVVLLAAGTLLRVAALFAYWPALEFYGDSYSYLWYAKELSPDQVRPFGYSAFLRLLAWSPSMAVVPAVQHLLGLGIGSALYCLSVHRGLSRRLSAAAATPVLLDAYQVNIEQMVMAETLFAALLTAAILVLLWRPRPSAPMCAGAGVLLATATLTRSVALVLPVFAGVYLLARSGGVRRFAAFGTGVTLPLVAYAAWFAAAHGSFALQNVDGFFLWGRVAEFADCSRIQVTPRELPLCSPHPPRERPGPNYYDWDANSPRFAFGPFDADTNTLFRRFALQVIAAQPEEYSRLVAHDVVHYLKPVRHVGPRDWYLATWQFQVGHPDPRWQIHRSLRDFDAAVVPRRHDAVLAGLLHGYQAVGFTPGPLLAGCVLVGVLASMAASGYGLVRVRHDCLLVVGMGLALLVVPCATAVFDYRYMLPALVCLPLAGAFGVAQLRLVHAQTRQVRQASRAVRSGQAGRSSRGGWWQRVRSSPETTSGPATPRSGSPAPS
ncbi:hypothetical protein [Candidatus Protofrankia californiensis]|uniref:hypothetical protein n=1 Tax=Candidatus Protofrankia californiensis TaxID=1839754 RepID=UPI0010418EA4|nr:hypothetical protein [Candidatus Protofrankia californiensis]